MQYITPRFRIRGTEYIVINKWDRPHIIELSRLDEEIKDGAQHYPLATDPDFAGWVEVPDDHFRLLESESCFDDSDVVFEEEADV